MVDREKEIICEPEEKKFNSNLIIDQESNKIPEDSTISEKRGFDLDYLDWIIDKGWLRIKK